MLGLYERNTFGINFNPLNQEHFPNAHVHTFLSIKQLIFLQKKLNTPHLRMTRHSFHNLSSSCILVLIVFQNRPSTKI